MELEEQSRTSLTINTTHGLYQYQRVPSGVASNLASGSDPARYPRVFCYLDDTIVTGSTLGKHLKRLVAVLKRLEEYS